MALRDLLKFKRAQLANQPSPTKFGVLIFSYSNAQNFAKSVSENGFFSLNLGDYMQTLAARQLLKNLRIPDAEVIDVDRDSLASYNGDPVILFMTGVFFPWSFPISERVVPVFLGFHASEAVIRKNIDYFRKYEPIGCRDMDTTRIFEGLGIVSFTSGCVTMTFDQRAAEPKEPKVLFVCGSDAGALPPEIVNTMPTSLLKRAEFVFQRKIVHRYPLTASDMKDAERYTAHLLDFYRRSATLIVTPLHHATTPCLSSGIPVVVCREKENTRFSFLEQIMNVYTPERFSQIDWAAIELSDLSGARSAFIDKAREKIAAVRLSQGVG